MSSFSQLLSPLLWSLLPSRLTHVLLPQLTSTFPGLLPPAPRNSPGYRNNYRLVYTFLVTAYLGYTFFNGSRERGDVLGSDDWYALLGVGRLASDEELKRAFRRLSRIYHPDRSHSTSDDSDAHFILLRKAYETLANPTLRYAYDRFGPDILNWGLIDGGSKGPESRSAPKKEEVGSVRDFIWAGLQASIGFYVVSGVIMALLALIGTAREGASLRLLLLLVLLTCELCLIASSTPTSLGSSPLTDLLPAIPIPLRSALPAVSWAFTPLLSPFRPFLASPQFLQIRLLHRVFTSLSIGVSQLAGVWKDPLPSEDDIWANLNTLVKGVEIEAVGAFQKDVIPLLTSGNPSEISEELQSGMETVLVDRAISSHPAVRGRWQHASALARQRHGSRAFTPHSGGVTGDVEVARQIPLPPSPPPSPRVRPRAKIHR